MDWLSKLEEQRLNQPKKFDSSLIITTYPDLDKIIGGGIPSGKIIEIAGHPGVGTSTLVLDIVASAQKTSKHVLFLDLDRKFDAEYATAHEVRCDELSVFRPDPTKPENTVIAVRELVSKGLIDVIVVDSISMYGDGMVELLQEFTKLQSTNNVTVILTSQLRHNFDDPRDYKTAHMKVLNQYCNVRIMLKKVESIKIDNILIGRRVSVDVYKNSVVHPNSTEIEIYF